MPLVREVMQSDVISLSRDQSLAEAMALLSANDISGAPICDGSGRVLGVLSTTDLLERTSQGLTGSVEEAMMPMVFSIGPDQTMDHAIAMMAFEGIHRLIVLDDEKRLVGILTAMDILRQLAGYEREATRHKITLAPPERRHGSG